MSSSSTVLLLSDDPVTLALLGMLVEMASFIPAFAAPGERPEDAMVRVRPSLVVLLDDSLDAVRSDVFFARAAQRRVALAVFPGKGSRRALKQRIGERGIPWFELPTDASNLASAIRSAAETRWWTRGADRRSLPAAERPDDGGLFFVDRAGRRWAVYDRRGSDRRQVAPGDQHEAIVPDDAAGVTRMFVSDGHSLETPLAANEVSAVSAAALEEQFLRATPVG